MTALNPDDPSPFRIGRLDKGHRAGIFETGGALAPVAAHDTPRNLFLLVRKPSGHMFIRNFTGAFLVRTMTPGCFIVGISDNKTPAGS